MAADLTPTSCHNRRLRWPIECVCPLLWDTDTRSLCLLTSGFLQKQVPNALIYHQPGECSIPLIEMKTLTLWLILCAANRFNSTNSHLFFRGWWLLTLFDYMNQQPISFHHWIRFASDSSGFSLFLSFHLKQKHWWCSSTCEKHTLPLNIMPFYLANQIPQDKAWGSSDGTRISSNWLHIKCVQLSVTCRAKRAPFNASVLFLYTTELKRFILIHLFLA